MAGERARNLNLGEPGGRPTTQIRGSVAGGGALDPRNLGDPAANSPQLRGLWALRRPPTPQLGSLGESVALGEPSIPSIWGIPADRYPLN
ncbi:hypothetical protein CRG98_040333 [Punica granatum]|uniref:Uncharacterized protein n=1 Tax=Punica granatum TaxID=22663 RepID=A0A2I0I5M4_PUNGR|nr:hypothetical protein CRG98_040333 [Punica granatum]